MYVRGINKPVIRRKMELCSEVGVSSDYACSLEDGADPRSIKVVPPKPKLETVPNKENVYHEQQQPRRSLGSSDQLRRKMPLCSESGVSSEFACSLEDGADPKTIKNASKQEGVNVEQIEYVHQQQQHQPRSLHDFHHHAKRRKDLCSTIGISSEKPCSLTDGEKKEELIEPRNLDSKSIMNNNAHDEKVWKNRYSMLPQNSKENVKYHIQSALNSLQGGHPLFIGSQGVSFVWTIERAFVLIEQIVKHPELAHLFQNTEKRERRRKLVGLNTYLHQMPIVLGGQGPNVPTYDLGQYFNVAAAQYSLPGAV
jgi:hypothetical protein